MKILNQWKSSIDLDTDEVFVMRDFDQKGRKAYWRYMRFSPRKDTELIPNPQPHGGDVIFDQKHKSLIYLDGKGVLALPDGSSEARRLYEVDPKSFDIGRIWLDPDCDNLYLMQTRLEPVAVPEARLAEFRKKYNDPAATISRSIHRESSLVVIVLDTLKQERIAGLGIPVSADMDWVNRRLVASVGSNLVEISLETGLARRLGDLGTHLEVAVSPKSSIILWNWQGSQIEELSPDGKKAPFVDNSLNPAFAPNGSWSAFLTTQNELGIRDLRGQVDLIVAHDPSDSHIYDTPSWCPCSRHVAVILVSGTSNNLTRAVVVADVVSKQVVVVDNASSVGGHTWLPGS